MKNNIRINTFLFLFIFTITPMFLILFNFTFNGLFMKDIKANALILVDPDRDPTKIDPPVQNSSGFFKDYNLSADKPYSNGALRRYTSLGVYNKKRDNTSWNGFNYAQFCRYFYIKRTDDRYIYDDDGILDISWNRKSLSDEIINYPCYFKAIESILPKKSGSGFLWTDEQAKFNDAVYNFSMDTNNSTIKCLASSINNKPTDNNPFLETIINANGQIVVNGATCLAIWLTGTGQFENTTWGNTGGDVWINENLTGYMKLSNRNWNNSLSVNQNVGVGTYNGRTAFYGAKPYKVIANNLDNYIKINDVMMSSYYGTAIEPFRDGHHISIDKDFTKVDIENGAENVYTTYYCFIDSSLPDISYTYHNANALTNRRVGNITTDTLGAKTQTINEGVFKDEVQVNFGYDANSEAPETATYLYNGETKPLTSGMWLTKEGDYTIIVKDLAGNTTISKFTIDRTAPTHNINRLQNDTSYKISRWYLATIPNSYKGSGTYSVATYNAALNLAKQAEYNTFVSSYTLSNVEDFKYTNLVANGDTIKAGDYWYYKSIENPNLFVYYFSSSLLDNAIEKYSKGFVSGPQTYKPNSTITPNNYGNVIDKSVLNNIINSGFIINNFTFKFSNSNDTYKIYYDYKEDSINKWQEFQYNIPFVSQVSANGLYEIKEIDFVGHETKYFVYLDLNAPMLDVEVKFYGKDKLINQTISVADKPPNADLIFYYEKFKIKNVIEDDTWWTIELKCPDNNVRRYTYLDTLPNFEELGSGEYDISVSDRANNIFKFKVVLLGKAPEVKFENINANSQLRVTISEGESYNELRNLKIFRNGICLNSASGYNEFPDNVNNPLIFIDINTKKYLFNKGGIYAVEITDSFGRTLTYEYKFEKDLPTGILVGVTHNGKTKDDVKFIYDNNKYFVVVSKDNKSYEPTTTIDRKITTLLFNPEEESEINYSIKLVDSLDTENYNVYSFTIKTIKPIIILNGVEPNGKTGGNVYATWNNGEEEYSASYTLNDETNEYKKGQNLTTGGSYIITLVDEIGNSSQVNFEIDKTIDFVLEDISEKTYNIEDIRYINFDIKVINKEPLNITLTKDDNIIDYEFGLMISEEGYYLVRLNDEFNNSVFFDFTIDKTPPTATLYGVEEFGKTNKSAWIISNESGLSCWYVRDKNFKEDYQIGKEITTNGKYVVYVTDLAKNYITFEFEIDKEIDYEINVYNGGISSEDVRLIAYENLKIVMYKDEKPFDYSFEQILKEDGEYSYTIVDDLGNRLSSFFYIIKKKKQNLNHILQENIKVESVTKNDEKYNFQVIENNLYLYDEGKYIVNIVDEKTTQKYTFSITLDTTPPTLDLINVENGGVTKNVVAMKNISEKPCTLYVTVDGIPFEYKVGEDIERCGRFNVVLTDEAGNFTTYTFERLYSLNGASIAVLAGLGALVVILIALLIKSRHHFYKDKVFEEETEQTIIEDDFNDENDNTPKI